MIEDRNSNAKSAVAIFYEDYNDVDIYIEDTAPGYRKIFKELLNKALSEQFKIEQIFPIGSRNEVIAECEKNQTKGGRKRLFIIDGDLYLLNGMVRNDLHGLFTLPRYCIENFLIDEDAIAIIAYESDPEMEVETIKESLNFTDWIKTNELLLVELFIYYALCLKYLPSVQTTGFTVNKLCASNTGIVCSTRTGNRIVELRTKLMVLLDEKELDEEILTIKENISKDDVPLIRYVSGKDYLLPLLITRLQSSIKFPTLTHSIKLRLAMKCNITDLSSAASYIYN